jgi:hypothetical protein
MAATESATTRNRPVQRPLCVSIWGSAPAHPVPPTGPCFNPCWSHPPAFPRWLSFPRNRHNRSRCHPPAFGVAVRSRCHPLASRCHPPVACHPGATHPFPCLPFQCYPLVACPPSTTHPRFPVPVFPAKSSQSLPVPSTGRSRVSLPALRPGATHRLSPPGTSDRSVLQSSRCHPPAFSQCHPPAFPRRQSFPRNRYNRSRCHPPVIPARVGIQRCVCCAFLRYPLDPGGREDNGGT